MTEMLNIREEGISKSVKRACDVLDRGGIIAYPTDTIYGLGVDPAISGALDKLYAVKERDAEKPVSLMLSGKKMLYDLFRDISPLEKRVIDNLFPGVITIVLNNSIDTIDLNETVGVRIPDDDFCRELVEKYGKPITTTSVNTSGMSPAVSASEVRNYFANEIDLILDGGAAPRPEGSTVIQIVNEKIKVLRQGILKEEDIMEIIDASG